ncbi:MAG: putative sulfate transporter [Bacteroidota bacterium]|nr:MAG: putative sulfate transporter [Bacteroidota bacterium]
MMKRLFPILSWLPNYKKAFLTGDLSAGFTVGIMLIPQSMAYAMIAGLPPVYGLYAALMPQLIYALMGTSPQLNVGPVAMDSLLVAAGLGALSISGIDTYIAMAIVLALFVGCIQVVLGVLKMGFLVNFLSTPVISGFTSAAALIIGCSQLSHLLGIEVGRSSKIQHILAAVVNELNQLNIYALSVGVIAIILILIFRKISKRIPAALVVVVLGILAVIIFKLDAKGVEIVAEIPKGLPTFTLPELDLLMLKDLFPIALTLALIAFMEAMSVAKVMERKHKSPLRPNQELIALGTANIVGAFFKSYPTTGSFTRSAIIDLSGAKTGLANLISAVIVVLTLLFLTPLFYYLPSAVLAAIILVAVFGLVEVKYPIQLFKTRKDEFVLLNVTFLLTLFVGITEGILFGTLLALLLMVYRTSKPHIAVLGRIKGTSYFRNINRFKEDIEPTGDVLILRFDAQLYFGNKDYFKSELLTAMAQQQTPPATIIIKSDSINYMDSSAVFMLENLIAELQQQGIALLFSELIGPTRDIIKKSKLIGLIGRENFFVNTNEAYEFATKKIPKTNLQEKISLQTKSED